MSCCASEQFRRRFSSIDYERATRISRGGVSIKNAPILLQALRAVGRVIVNVVMPSPPTDEETVEFWLKLRRNAG
jgi:hypothetical protein